MTETIDFTPSEATPQTRIELLPDLIQLSMALSIVRPPEVPGRMVPICWLEAEEKGEHKDKTVLAITHNNHADRVIFESSSLPGEDAYAKNSQLWPEESGHFETDSVWESEMLTFEGEEHSVPDDRVPVALVISLPKRRDGWSPAYGYHIQIELEQKTLSGGGETQLDRIEREVHDLWVKFVSS